MPQDLMTLPHPDAVSALREISLDRLGFAQRCTQDYQGQGIIPLQLGDELFCLLTNPDYITQVLKDRLSFIKSKDMQLVRRILGNGLLTSEGDFWLRQRRLAQPIFHQQKINSYGDVMVEYTQQMLTTWQDGSVLDVHEEMMRLTLNIVMKTLFDQDVQDSAAGSIAHAINVSVNWLEHQDEIGVKAALRETGDMQVSNADLSSEEMDRQLQSALEQLDETVYAMINQRRELSDFIFALAMALMVIAFDIPDHVENMTNREIDAFLISQLQSLATYAVKFTLIAFYWISYSQQFSYLRRTNVTHLWISVIYLMGLFLVPLSNGLVMTFPHNLGAKLWFSLNIAAIGFASSINLDAFALPTKISNGFYRVYFRLN
jgi:cytochrome P450